MTTPTLKRCRRRVRRLPDLYKSTLQGSEINVVEKSLPAGAGGSARLGGGQELSLVTKRVTSGSARRSSQNPRMGHIER